MPELAKKITLDQGAKRLYVDGVEFPWFISADGVNVTGLGTKQEIPMVHLAIPAVTVEVIPEPVFENYHAGAVRLAEDGNDESVIPIENL